MKCTYNVLIVVLPFHNLIGLTVINNVQTSRLKGF